MELKDLAKRLQFIDHVVPASMRVAFRYRAQRLVGGLEPEMGLLPKLVPRDKVALDVGANRGTYAFALAKLARRVLSFEPVPECVDVLKAWAAKTDNVEINGFGLGDHEVIAAVHIPRRGHWVVTTRASFARVKGDGVDVPVPVRTLDSLQIADVGFVKIDVEGFEYAVLRGGRATLEHSHPVILIEIDPGAQSYEDFARTFDFIEQLGYRGNYVHEGKLVPCRSDIYFSGAAAMNYVFTP